MKRYGMMLLLPLLMTLGVYPQAQHDRINARGTSNFDAIIDVRAYGVRMFAASTTGSIKSGSPTLTIGAASGFINGDGIVVRGAGTNNSVSTPAAPSVTGANAAVLTGTGLIVGNRSGATTYQYQIVARTKGGGYTAASAATVITNGPATLGHNSVKISSITRSNATVTVNTAAPHNLVVGSMVVLTNTTNLDFDGWFIVTTVPSNTQFTVSSNKDSRNGALTSGGAAGTADWYNCNHVSWRALTGAWQYYIYGRTGGAMVLLGISQPENTSANTLEGYDSWDDFGSTMTAAIVANDVPDWVPLTPPVAARNNDLVTTILSGGGTTTLTLAANASNTVAGARTKFDNAPTILAAANAANTRTSALYFPHIGSCAICAYGTESVLTLPSANLVVVQNHNINLGDTLYLPGGKYRWSGEQGYPKGRPTFGFVALSEISSRTAYPMIYTSGAANFNLSYVTVTGAMANNAQLMQIDGGDLPGMRLDHVQFVTSGNRDYMSRHLTSRSDLAGGGAGWFLDYVTFIGGPNVGTNNATPLVFTFNGGGSMWTMRHTSMNRRGILFMGGTSMSSDWLTIQGNMMPIFTLGNHVGNAASSMDIRHLNEDTAIYPVVNNFGNASGLVKFTNVMGITPGYPMFVSPDTKLTLQIEGSSASNNYGPNTGMVSGPISDFGFDGRLVTSGTGYVAITKQNASLSIGTPYTAFVNSLPQAAPSCSVSAGGSVPLGTYTFKTAPVFASAGEGTPSAISSACTTTPGNQTITITWATVPGASGYDLYKCQSGCFSFQATPPWVIGGNQTGYVWSSVSPTGASAPRFAAGGPSYIASDSIGSMALKLVNNRVDTILPTTLTAGRTQTLPDLTGTFAFLPTSSNVTSLRPGHIPVGASNTSGTLTDGVHPMSVYDSFRRANGTIQAGNANWITSSGTINVTSNVAVGGTGGGQSNALYTGVSFVGDDQTAKITIGQSGNGAGQIRVLARASTSANTAYLCGLTGASANFALTKVVAGAYTTLQNVTLPSALVAGDTISINTTGTTISCYVNGTQVAQQTDSAIASGYPGISFFNNNATNTIADFSASYGSVSLNLPQTWNAIQTAGTGGGFDASAVTSATAGLRMPNIAGAAPTTAGALAYDMTNKNVHVGANGVDNIFGLAPASVTIADNDCVKWTVVGGVKTLNSYGAICAASPMTTLGDILYEDGTPAPARLPGPKATNGVTQVLTSTPSGGVATAPVWAPLGVGINPQTGTTYTIAATDRGSYLSFSNASPIAVTLPQAGTTGFGSNFVFVACAIGAGTATITPTTSTISYSTGAAYTAAAARMTLTTGQCAWVYSDNTNYFAIRR
jgi:hypothetical protein